MRSDEQPPGVPSHLVRQDSSEHLPSPSSIPLALSLSQNQFVGLASDRQAEARSYTGWNYAAIAAVMRVATSATVEIFDDRIVPGQRRSGVDYARKSQRKSLVGKYGQKWKSFAKRPELTQMADPEFRWWKLTHRPNPWQDGSSLRATIIQQMRLHGIAIVWNVKNAFGKTVWRFSIPMAMVSPIPPGSQREMPMGGVHVYSFGWMVERWGRSVYGDLATQYIADRDLSMSDLSVYAYPHPFLPGDGASPTTAMKQWIDLSSKAEATQAGQFDRGPQKKALVQPPADVEMDSAALKAWQRGLDRMWRQDETGLIAVATGSVTELSMTPDEMGYMESSTYGGDATLGGHGVPKAAIGMSEGMTYGSVAAAMRGFTTLSVQPDLDIIAGEDTLQMQAEEGDAFEVGYICPEFDDPELKETQLVNDVAAGVVTVGEYRVARGMEPFGDDRDNLLAGSMAIKEHGSQTAGLRQSFGMGSGLPSAQSEPADAAGITGNQPEAFLGQFAGLMGGSQKSLVNAQSVAKRDGSPYVVAVALDGTLSQGPFDEFDIGEPDSGMVEAVRAMSEAGCGIVVYTARESETTVANWLDENGIPFDAINENPWAKAGANPMLADMFLDQRAVNSQGSGAAVMAAVIDQVADLETKEAIRKAVYKRRMDRLYGFLFVPVDGAAARVVEEARRMLDPSHLAGDGLEAEPHITLLHAVAERTGFRVAQSIEAIGGFNYEIGRLETFVRGDTAYLVIKVRGVELDRVRLTCESSLTHIRSEWTWNPHIAVGVIDAKFADQYANRELPSTGKLVSVKKLVYRPPGDADIVIPLK